MEQKSIINKVEDYVYYLFKEKAPSENVYHDSSHTTDVVEAAKEIGKASKLSEDEMEIITIAAWFHDVGYIEGADNHEEKSAEYAKNFLAENDYPRERIEKTADCIMATKVPQKPKNMMEKVICDADLQHLGTKDFFDKSELFRMEAEQNEDELIHDFEWYKKTIDFLTNHNYFTDYAIEKYDEQKQENLVKLQKKFRKKVKKKENKKLKKEKIELQKEKIEIRKEKEKRPDRGVDTMFRNAMRTHVEFSSMADNKANIMISVNTILITILVTVLARKLDNNPHLIIPTAIITLASLTTLIFAVMVTRPKVTEAKFSREDIKNRIANLLYFGNFADMSFKDFEWGFHEMMGDKDFLYNSMIKDFYYLGKVLHRKYKYLRICYTVFIVGLVISIMAFALAIFMYPEGTQLGPLID